MKTRLIWVIAALLLFFGCAAPEAIESVSEASNETLTESADAEMDAISTATSKRYREGELREYDGIRLNPAIGPRDNSISGTQQVDITTYLLTIDGLVQDPLEYTYEEVKSFPSEQRIITVYCVEGWDATILWEGVPLKTLLESANPNAEANTVIFHAVDGYTTSLPLQEIMDQNLILAYNANGLALPPEMGYPLIFVAEDKWGYKWARWINRIELSSDESYKGYWENYGYSNDGNLNEPSR